jgi:tRNA-splicing ligase RtcB (3'-phosphate/5'-hydroxy nucleic acid ligase)
MRVIETDHVPVMSWANDLPGATLEQALGLAQLPFVFSHIALMGDVQPDHGVPIGSVMATSSVIYPRALGTDIGCGVTAAKTKITLATPEMVSHWCDQLRRMLPIAQKAQPDTDYLPEYRPSFCPVVEENRSFAIRDLGTLGGGNHCIQFLRGEDGCLWVIVHAGSGRIGKAVAAHYEDVARDFVQEHRREHQSTELPYLLLGSAEGQCLAQEMRFCADYAKAGRELIMQRIIWTIDKDVQVSFDTPTVECPHDSVSAEQHFGRQVLVHRRGVISAKLGHYGLVSAPQGKMLVVRGKGHSYSFMSCAATTDGDLLELEDLVTVVDILQPLATFKG